MKARAGYLRDNFSTLITQVIAIVVVAIFFFPIAWLILSSFKNPADMFTGEWLFTPTLVYHEIVWFDLGFGRYLLNSLIVSLGTAGLAIPLGSLAAYAFSRYKVRGSFPIASFVMATRMLPRILLMFPLFLVVIQIGLYDTPIALIMCYASFNLPFTIWLLRSFFMDVPRQLDEAAMLDGCSRLGAFVRVFIPAAIPGILAATIFSFGLAWTEFFFGLILTSGISKTLPVQLGEMYMATWAGGSPENWPLSAAGTLAVIIPSMIIVTLARKHLVSGLSFGVVKE